ncbi:hypothetical protein RR48_05469 [Papilio machaon]|uniref:Uncharacterized protein n=1 Tax=Papilio machaon TaxID=76193 RepID=A0A0N1PHE0_PAPMA|nr:hypothetical protein RR48_05469 [Papilio machaon]
MSIKIATLQYPDACPVRFASRKRSSTVCPRNDSRGRSLQIALVLGRRPRSEDRLSLSAAAEGAERDAATDRGILITGTARTGRRYHQTCV